MSVRRVAAYVTVLLFVVLAAGAGFVYWYDSKGQQPDLDFIAAVGTPAYAGQHPLVLVDAAHNNWHTISGRYRPLAQLLEADGYRVEANRTAFAVHTLDSAKVLIIANALGPKGREHIPAFEAREDSAVAEWVRNGGSLLLIADHAPFGAAAQRLASAFGVSMYLAFARDDKHSGWDNERIIFTRADGLVGRHPITDGRNASEAIDTVRSFTGQSLSVPVGATPLLRMDANAYDWESRKVRHSAAGHAQGVAFSYGQGRVVVLGEAGMLSAQVDPLGFKMGMNAGASDNRQFALNILHWLSHLY